MSPFTGIEHFISWLEKPKNNDWMVVHHEVLPESAAVLRGFPVELHPQVTRLAAEAGITSLFSHQAEAVKHALEGKNVILSTSTASGKTLAYQLPVLDRLLRDPAARALFLFPLKALERDQRDSFVGLCGDSGITSAVYDGDTPDAERRKIRSRPPRVLITNPDMLHMGLLANHDTWKAFFGNLAFVVLDEVHTYKGIFGTHVSQLLLRLKRVCAHHGSTPGFIACSATVANPGPFVSRLLGEEVAVVDRSGAGASERHFLFLSPVLSPYTVAARLFTSALAVGLKTIVFTRARRITELITTWVLQSAPHLRSRISSYRAGFLPEERREIEAKLFSGIMDGVISTSALEMGIDVGGLDLCLLVGYPGTIINTWQRGGRVGRAGRPSAIVMLAGNDALDQYFLRNPHDFFRRNCEEAVLDPFNPEVLKRHLPCAAREVPIHEDEPWTREPSIEAVLHELKESRALVPGRNGELHSTSHTPHREVDLRGIGESYPIFLEDRKTLVGASSGGRAFKECHEGAVYLHRARQYVVTKLDLEKKNVLVATSRLNYYTRALAEKDTEILSAPIRAKDFKGFGVREARLKVTEQITGYEKRRTGNQELLGVVDLGLPPLHFETVGIWIEIPEKVQEIVKDAGLHFMGGIHALEHAAISMFPLFALCDRDDIGGISTPLHRQVCRPAVFIYDGHPGGVGLSHRAFDVIEELLEKTRSLVETCPCDDGCPSCIHSPKCGSGNKPLDKVACLLTLDLLLHPDEAALRARPRKPAALPASPRADKPGELPPRPAKPVAAITAEATGKRSPSEVTSSGRHRPAVQQLPPGTFSRQEKKMSASLIFPDLAPPTPEKTVEETTEAARVALKPKTGRRRKESIPQRVVVFDLETQFLADEIPGGWSNVSGMLLSLGVTHSEPEGFLTFTEENVSQLIDLLKSADLVVGFNQMRFDYEVLKHYSTEDLRSLPNLDILVELKAKLGFFLSLDHVAGATLGEKKGGSGLDAVKWFREGKMNLLEKYCREDVRITRDLYRFGLDNGHLLYRAKTGGVKRVEVEWKKRP